MTAADSISETRADSIAELTLNRPDKLNSMTSEMRMRLLAVLRDVAADSAIRAVIITGAGRAFCAGEDLAEVSGPDAGPELFREIVGQFNAIVSMIRTMEKPVIAAVNGTAAGAGANLALACDFVVAADSAAFVQSFVHIGLVPDTGGSYFLPRLVGPARARELLLLGDKVAAADAQTMGLIYRAVPGAELAAHSRALAVRLTRMSGTAIGLTKRLLEQSADRSLDAQLALELELQVRASDSADFQEGLHAFLEKRRAVFNNS